MADALGRHYAALTAHERFALLVEAMARGDDAEADRLEDTCPRFTYRMEDAQFRGRMRCAYTITSMVCLNMRAGLAQIRMAAAFSVHARDFAAGPARVAEVAFLFGRAYGRWEAGAADDADVPDGGALAAELEAAPELKSLLAEVREAAGERVQEVADAVHHAVGHAHAVDLLSQWEGFGQFCRDVLGVGPLALMTSFGLVDVDPGTEVLAACPGLRPDKAGAAGWAGHWASVWDRRFGGRR